MKTYIVQLEDHDDVISAQDKISWGKASRVLLVWPRRGRVLERRVDLLLLLRYARQIGSQLAVVTRSGEVQINARALGIPLFTSTEEAQQVAWRRPRRRKLLRPGREQAGPQAFVRQRTDLRQTQALPRVLRLSAFVLGVLAFLSTVLIFAPGAEIHLEPAQATQALTISVWASKDIQTPGASGGLPARDLAVVVEGNDAMESTGQTRVPDSYATGEVLFTNLTDQPVDVPAGSVVVTLDRHPARFVTIKAVQVPSGPGKTAMTAIQAEAAGRAGNLPAGEIKAMEGSTGLRVTVENVAPTKGGSDRTSLAPGQADEQALRSRLSQALQETAAEELWGKIQPGQVILPGSLHLNKILEENRQPAENQPGDRLQLSMRVEYQALVVDERDLQAVAQAALDATREPNYRPVEGSLHYEFTGEVPEPGSGQTANARWKMKVERQLETDWSEAKLVKAIQGQTVENARSILQAGLLLQSPPKINLWPTWWVRIPFLPFRIRIIAA